MIKYILIALLAIAWVAIARWGYKKANQTFSKYSKCDKIEDLDPKFNALIRGDFSRWNKQRILIGCWTLLPFRVISFGTLFVCGMIFPALLMIFGQRTIIIKLFNIYLNTYGRFIIRILCQIEEQYENKKIQTPIVISNHVTWFDIFYFMMGHSPISFLAKAEVQKWPAIGIIATAIQSIYVKRDSEQAKREVRQKIKQRIEKVKQMNKNIFPLLIYPEGTTSNGKGLLTFKNGAFEHLPPITAYCLKYECNGFDMGMDEISQIEHTVIMMSLLPKLIVRRIQFTPNIGEAPEEYQNRCRNQMAKVLSIPCTNGGFREKIELIELRKAKKHK